MVTKPMPNPRQTNEGFVLAKKLMVTKLLLKHTFNLIRFVLAKKLMVTKLEKQN